MNGSGNPRRRQGWSRCPRASPSSSARARGASCSRATRPPRLERARAVLRGLADLPRDPRRRERHDLRRGRERVARRRRLAQRRPRRDVGALERGPRLRRGRRPQAVEGLGPDGGPRPAAGGRGGGRRVREPRRRRDLVAAPTLDGQPGRDEWNDPDEPAARPSRPAGDPAAPRRRVALLGDRPGVRHLRDDRRRRVVDAAQPRACAPSGRSSTPRSATASTSS